MPAPTAYVDVPTFQQAAMGLAIQPYVGANSTLSTGIAAGVTSLPVLASAGILAGQAVYLLDGPLTEIVYADLTTPAPDGTHIKLQAPGTVNAHSAGVSVSSAGQSGCLAQMILQASGWIENTCMQGTPTDRSLWALSRTEKLYSPSTRAFLDGWDTLRLRPRRFPITSVTSVTLELSPGSTMTLDATQVELDAFTKDIAIPLVQPTSAQLSPAWLYGPPVDRYEQYWVTLVYMAGLTWGQLPWDFTQAAILAVQHMLSLQFNPQGAVMVRQDDTNVLFEPRVTARGDKSSDSRLLAQARGLLAYWMSDAI